MDSAALWIRASGEAPGSVLAHRARALALLAAAAPPMFVFIAFLLGVLGRPVPETAAWVSAWLLAGVWTMTGSRAAAPPVTRPAAAARVAHGALAALILVFIGFHLSNHLAGWLGPETHRAVMGWGREVYRRPAVEALLVGVLLLQVALGAWLTRRWSQRAVDGFRAVQLATGVYLGVFALTHMNSALVSARWMHGTQTDWRWASGAPEGLLPDAWNIRLVPHYALGVFCVLAHLACGLRAVLLAHGAPRRLVNPAWAGGLLASAAVAALILAGLCGARIAVA